MKLNIAYPATGCQKLIEVDDENKLRAFYDKRMSAEVDGAALGDEFKEYVFKISGGNDKQGFPMKQGVLTSARVRLLLSKGHSCYRPRREGERKRKSVRGCVVSSELSVLNLVVVKKGPADIPGLTDSQKPRRLGPKRASKIRKLFNLTKKDDVRDYVVKRRIVKDGKKAYFKKPQIQRLITPQRLQRKRAVRAEIKSRYMKSQAEAKEYNAIIAERFKEQKGKRASEVTKRRSESSMKKGETSGDKDKAKVDVAKSEKKKEKKEPKTEKKKGEGKKGEGKKGEGKKSEGKKSEGKKSEGKKSEGKKPEGKKPEGKKKEAPKKEKVEKKKEPKPKQAAQPKQGAQPSQGTQPKSEKKEKKEKKKKEPQQKKPKDDASKKQ